MSEQTLSEYPMAQARDHLRTVAEAAVSLAPMSGPLVKLLELLVPSLDKRRGAWAKEVTILLNNLQENQLTPEKLATDEEWISAVFEASQVAISTHVETKLQMLRRLLENMAIKQPRGEQEVIVRRFLRFIEELDEEHFIVLKYASDPSGWFTAKGIEKPSTISGSQSIIIKSAKLNISDDVLSIILNDLTTRQLISTDGFTTMVSQYSLYDKFTKSLGDQLLDWVWRFDE